MPSAGWAGLPNKRMATLVWFGLISAVWAGIGVAMVVAPSSWQGWVRRAFVDPVTSFMVSQGLMLAGLLLMLGAGGHRARWLWMAIGLLMVAKALVLLGLTASRREGLLRAWERFPAWTLRVIGLLTVTLATLLAIDTIRGPQ